jgi:hypothetical protein
MKTAEPDYINYFRLRSCLRGAGIFKINYRNQFLRDIWNRITEIHAGSCSGHRNVKYVSLRKWTTIQSEFRVHWWYIIHSKRILKETTKLSTSVTRQKIGNVLKTFVARSRNIYTSSDIVTARYHFHSKRALLWRLNGAPNKKKVLRASNELPNIFARF